MFTGLITGTGEITAVAKSNAGATLTLRAPSLAATVKTGESISVNGCCLTAVRHDLDSLSFDLLQETLRRTNLGELTPGELVNLEPALSPTDKLGGHFVQGHIDTSAPILGHSAHGGDFRLEVQMPPEFSQFVISKGSIAVDGISLTVAELLPASFVCWIIPHTRAVTNLRNRLAGHRVNLEFDMIAKYVERILSVRLPRASS